MVAYPPQPWNLVAEACLSVWAVPRRQLPRVSQSVTPVTVGGTAFVVTAWIDYRPPSELTYHELLATVAVRHGVRPAGTITEIWVDNEASLRGGRELWGIPKDRAAFDFSSGNQDSSSRARHRFTASTPDDECWIATAGFAPRNVPALRLPARFAIVQTVDDAAVVSPVRATGTPRPASAEWNINPDGPLGYLADRRPITSLQLSDVQLRFGSTSPG